MSKTINDILFSDMSHNSRVFKLYTKINESLMRYNEVLKSDAGRFDNERMRLEKKRYYGLKKGREVGQDAINDKKLDKKYDEYMEDLKQKRISLKKNIEFLNLTND